MKRSENLFVTPWNSPWNSPGQTTGVGSLSFSRGSSQPRDWTQVSCTVGVLFTSWAVRDALMTWRLLRNIRHITSRYLHELNIGPLFIWLQNKSQSPHKNHKSLIFHSYYLSALTPYLLFSPYSANSAALAPCCRGNRAALALVLGPLHILFPHPSVLLRFLDLQIVCSNITFHPSSHCILPPSLPIHLISFILFCFSPKHLSLLAYHTISFYCIHCPTNM